MESLLFDEKGNSNIYFGLRQRFLKISDDIFLTFSDKFGTREGFYRNHLCECDYKRAEGWDVRQNKEILCEQLEKFDINIVVLQKISKIKKKKKREKLLKKYNSYIYDIKEIELKINSLIYKAEEIVEEEK